MIQEEILDGNKLIAEFMGWTQQLDVRERWYGAWFDQHRVRKAWPKGHEPLLFHESWDWLMPVVEKIESIVFDENNSFNVTIGSSNYCVIQDSNGEVYEFIEDYKESKLLTTYSAVVNFIKWYNENKKT